MKKNTKKNIAAISASAVTVSAVAIGVASIVSGSTKAIMADDNAPTVTANADNNTWSKTKTIKFKATDGVSKGVQVSFIDRDHYQPMTEEADGSFSAEFTMTGDVYAEKELTAYFKDAMGNETAQVFTVNKLDNTAPVIVSVSDPQLSEDGKSASFSITQTTDACDRVSDSGQKVEGEGSGAVAYAINTSRDVPEDAAFTDSTTFTVDENGTYYLFARDVVGNISAPLEVTVDNIKPIVPNKVDIVLTIDPVANQQFTKKENIVVFSGKLTQYNDIKSTVLTATFNGKAVDAANIKLNDDATFTISVDTASLDVADTAYALNVSAVDANDGKGNATSGVKILNTAPKAVKGQCAYDANKGIVINGSIEDYNYGQNLTVEYSIDNGEWKKASLPAIIADGASNITFIVTDATETSKSLRYRAFDGIEYSNIIEEDITNFILPAVEETVGIKVTNVTTPITEGTSATVTLKAEASSTGSEIKIYRIISGKETLIKTYTSNGQATTVTDTLAGLPVGSNAIKYEIRGDGKTASDTTSVEVKAKEVIQTPTPDKNTPPELYIYDIDTVVSTGQKINATLKVSDEDEGQKVKVYYSIDKGSKVEVDSFKSKGKTVTIETELPDDLTVGEHTVVFWAVDEEDAESNEDGDVYIKDINDYKPSEDKGNKIDITVKNNAPTVKIISCPTEAKVGDAVPVSISSQDIDVKQDVTVFYQIDGKWPETINKYTSNGSAVTHNFDIKGLEEGTHTLTFWAEDSLGAKSNANGNVSINNLYGVNRGEINQVTIKIIADKPVNTPPMLDIITKLTKVYSDEDVNVSISVLDKDKGQKVTSYYTLNDSENKTIATFTSSGIANVQKIALGKLKAGEYTLVSWAIDEAGARSDADTTVTSIDKTNVLKFTVIDRPKNAPIKTGVESTASNNKGIAAAIVGAIAVIGGGISILSRKKK